MTRELRIVGEIAPEGHARVAHASRLDTLEEVLRFGCAQRWEVAEVIVQDEFTHDVVVSTPTSTFIVFDTT